MNERKFKTAQEDFWAGDFGNQYIGRNDSQAIVAANLARFSEVLRHTDGLRSVIEFGANIGMNMLALRQLLPRASLSAIEINPRAAEALRALGYVSVHEGSILEYAPAEGYDLALIKGVLIHINPDHLATVYDALHASSNRYICMVEYYNPTPVTVPYRGHDERLFKRDFAGELMDRHPDLKLLAYGFNYHRDPAFAFGDDTWFLMEKQA
jgi:spore coat polysaccharide biosynthesis protein SpsF